MRAPPGLWAPPLILALVFLVSALSRHAFAYAAPDLLLLAALYVLLAASLHFGSLLAARLALPLGVLACLGVGAVLHWHLREQQLLAFRAPGFALVSVLLGLAWLAVVLPSRRVASVARLGTLTAGAAILFVTTLVLGFDDSNTFRFHLLRQNKLIGTPAYFLLADPVRSIREVLWNDHAAAAARDASRPLSAPDRWRASGPAAGPRPHVVLVMVDTLRADALSAWGGDPSFMPETNRLASRSIVLRDVRANATWTRPSVASLLTGLLPEQHGAVDRGDRLTAERTTLAEVLGAGGYTTAAFVANFAAIGRDSGFDQGFDHFEEVEEEGSPYARAERINQAVTSWLEQRGGAGAGPVFLYLHYLDPHRPYLSGGTASPGSYPSAYVAELHHLDRQLERLRDRLERLLPGRTLLLITSDHGEEFREHGEGGHGHSLYPELTHVPAILHDADRAPRTVDARLEVRDLFDLVVYLAAVPDGDVTAWLAAHDRPRRYQSLYLTAPFAAHRPYRNNVCMRAIDEEDYLFIWSAYGRTVELYDVASDPDVTTNLARSDPERVGLMRQAMDRAVPYWVERVPVKHTAKTEDLLRQLGYIE